MRPPSDRLVERVAIGSVGLTALVGAVAAARSSWRPAADLALIELRARDVPAHLPLIGAYSRLGWSHPGPAWFGVLAVPYRLLGSSSSALLTAAWCTAIAGVLASWWVARRVDRLAGSIVLAVSLVATAGVEATTLRNPWNPYASLVLGGTLVVLCWAVAQRRPVPALVAPAVATVLVQAHLGALPLAVAVLVLAYALALWPDRSAGTPAHDTGDDTGDDIGNDTGGHAGSDAGTGEAADVGPDPRGPVRRRALLGGVGIAAVLWIPPLIQQITGDPGNLTAIARSTGRTDATTGIGFALRLVSGAFAVVPTWAGARTSTALNVMQPTWRVPVLVLIPVAAVVVASRRRDRAALRGLALCAVAVLAAVVAAARIDGPPFAHLVPWINPVAATTVALGLWVLCRHLLPGGAGAWVPTIAGAVTVVAAAVLITGQLGADVPDRTLDDALASIGPAVLDDADRNASPTGAYVDSELDFGSLAATPGVILQLERAGIDTRGDVEDVDRLGEHRVGPPLDRTHYRLAPVASVPALTAAGWTVVATYDPFTAAERDRLDELGAEARTLTDERRRAVDAGADTDEVDRRLRSVAEEQVAVLRDRLDVAVLRRTTAE